MQRYNPKAIEAKWQKKWATDSTYKVDLQDSSKPKFYGFAMLPYPSGTGLHTGHVRTYTLADVTVRAKRQQGFNAYNPIGWDAFGLPAENYAIKTGTPPKETIAKATARFREQLSRIGMSYDWDKEINTSYPEYYKWTQWIFTKLFEHGLAYQKESLQWWCSIDKTVLANEQVVNGKCWRHDGPNDPLVTKKSLKQWFFKITDYADELLEATDDLDWPNSIKTMQKNWIGKSKGAEISFAVDSDESQMVVVFTTRPDTIYGATFMVLAPEHPLIKKITTDSQRQTVETYVAESQAKSEIERMDTGREKTGEFTGAYAINPVNQKKIPIWTADYVLMGYGTGAIMAVPAHDERDYEFAKKFNLPAQLVVEPVTGTPHGDDFEKEAVVVVVHNPHTKQTLMLDWGPRRKNWGGMLFVGGGVETGEDLIKAAEREVAEETGYTKLKFIRQTELAVNNYYYSNVKNRHDKAHMYGILFELEAEDKVSQLLDDGEKNKFKVTWIPDAKVLTTVNDSGHELVYRTLMQEELFSGEGIMINSGSYSGMPSSEAREKIVADLVKKNVAEEKVNYKIRDWLISRQRYWGAPIPIVHCTKDGAIAVPESQLPVVLPDVKSYQPTGEGTSVLADVDEWVNTSCPKCGGPARRETDTMDGYACSSWYFLRYLDPHNDTQAWNPEVVADWMPIDFYNGADHAVSHLLYSRFWTRFFYKLGLVGQPEPVKRLIYNAYILATDGTKMSKSKGNVVDPLEVIDSGYGADALRVYEMFIAPYDMEAPWNTQGVPGTYRFLRRVWDLTRAFVETKNNNITIKLQNEKKILQITHKTIKKVTNDIEAIKFNTAVAAMMEMVNDLHKLKEVGVGGKAWLMALESLVQLLAPFAPHISEELWHQLGHQASVHIDHWPAWEDKYLQLDEITIIVQVNGKLRAQLKVATNASEEEIKRRAVSEENVDKFIESKKPTKIVYVPGRLVNIVL